MKLFSPKFLVLTCALGAIPSFAQADAPQHPGTEAGLQCLLRTAPRDCGQTFVAEASIPARFWTTPNSKRDFELGPVVSTRYAGADPGAQAIAVPRMPGQASPFDIYDVKYAHQDVT